MFMTPEEQARQQQGQQMGAQQGQPMAVGSPADQMQTQAGPMDPQLASPEEQLQYEDLTARFLSYISDQREPPIKTKAKSPADQFIELLNRKNVPFEEALGMAVGVVMQNIYANAKRQGYQYSPDVLLGAADLNTRAAYVVAKYSGVLKDAPPSIEDGGKPEDEFLEEYGDDPSPELQQQLMASDFESYQPRGSDGNAFNYDFSMEELEFIEGAKMELAKYFGNYLMRSGELDHGAWQQMAEGIVNQEYESGALDEEDDFPFSQEQVEAVMNIPPAGGENGA